MGICTRLVRYIYPDIDYTWFVREARKNISAELDFEKELGNQQKCAQIFHDNEDVHVPEVYPELSTGKVITMEFCSGMPLYSKEALVENNVNLDSLSKLIATTFYQMIFKHGFIHSDPHPANMLIRKKKNDELQLVLLDHGLYRPISEDFRVSYSNLWMSLLDRDAKRIQKYCRELNVEKNWHFFASMVTLSPWKDANTITREEPTKEQMQKYLRMYFKQISNVLSEMPAEMALIFKTRDQLRALDQRLGVTKLTKAQDKLISLNCIDALEESELKRAFKPLEAWSIRLQYAWRRIQVLLKFWCLNLMSNYQ